MYGLRGPCADVISPAPDVSPRDECPFTFFAGTIDASGRSLSSPLGADGDASPTPSGSPWSAFAEGGLASASISSFTSEARAEAAEGLQLPVSSGAPAADSGTCISPRTDFIMPPAENAD